MVRRKGRARLACLLLLHGAPAHVRGVQSTVSACVDEDSHCKQWSQMGECENNPGFMGRSCKRSCGLCSTEQRGATVLGAGD